MTWEDVQALRKQGQFRQAIELGLEELLSSNDRRVRSQLDWAWYGLVKELVASIEAKQKASEPVMQADVDELLCELRRFAKQPNLRPDNALSNILRAVSRVAPHLPSFPGFVRWIGIDGLSVEDWQYGEYNDKAIQPVAMKAARALAKWVKAHPDAGNNDIEYALQWLERIRPVALGDEALWLDWDRALMRRRLGEYALAAEILSNVLKAKRGEFWVWAEAAQLYADEHPDLALACYCRERGCGAQPKLTANVHRELAQ